MANTAETVVNNHNGSKLFFETTSPGLPAYSFGEKDSKGNWIFNGVVYIFRPAEGQSYNKITKDRIMKAYRNGMLDIANGVYAHVEPHFVLKVPVAELKTLAYKEEVATVEGAFYNGQFADYIQGKRDGLYNLTWMNGTFIYGSQIFDSEGLEGEPEWVTKKRRTFFKRMMQTLYMQEAPVKFLYYPQDEKIVDYVREWARLMDMKDVAARKQACQDGLNNFLTAKDGHAVDREFAGEVKPLATQEEQDATFVKAYATFEPIAIATLVGKKYMKYRFASPQGTVEFTNDNLAYEVSLVLKSRLTLREIKK